MARRIYCAIQDVDYAITDFLAREMGGRMLMPPEWAMTMVVLQVAATIETTELPSKFTPYEVRS